MIQADRSEGRLLRLTGLHPTTYLAMRGSGLRPADGLIVTVGDSEAEVVRLDGRGLDVRIVGALDVGEYAVSLENQNRRYVAAEPLLVVAEITNTMGTADGGVVDDAGSVFDGGSSPDSGARHAGPPGITLRDGGAPGDAGPTLSCMEPACAATCSQRCGDRTCSCMNGCPCGFGCTGSGSCNPICTGAGTQCKIDIESVEEATPTCRDGASCEVACLSVEDRCVLTCQTGARCRLVCSSRVPCRIEGCSSGVVTCPDGSVVCNRACGS